jgi:4-hydroxymandelate oxidase
MRRRPPHGGSRASRRATKAPEARPPVNLFELEEHARAKAAPATWDYFAGGSEDEVTLRANRTAFEARQLWPRVLTGVTAPSLETSALGTSLKLPIGLAPVGYQRLAHEDGEEATARAAARTGALMVVSAMASTRIEALASLGANLWFQLYVMRDPATNADLVRRAEDAGCRALVVTVDATRLGRRERDLRNGFALPPHITAANLPAANAASLHVRAEGGSSLATHATFQFEGALDWNHIDRLRAATKLPLVLKGILSPQDAERAVEVGAQAVWVSNHGGRQLDGSPASFSALPEVVRAVRNRVEVYMDGGIRRGTDVAKALALGARIAFIGRPQTWGLLTGGEQGVELAIALLRAELENVLILSGRTSVQGVDESLLRPSQ